MTASLKAQRQERVESYRSDGGEIDARLTQASERQVTGALRLHRQPMANDSTDRARGGHLDTAAGRLDIREPTSSLQASSVCNQPDDLL